MPDGIAFVQRVPGQGHIPARQVITLKRSLSRRCQFGDTKGDGHVQDCAELVVTMHHRLLHRILAAACGLWLVLSLTEPAAVNACAMHGAATHLHGSGGATHAGAHEGSLEIEAFGRRLSHACITSQANVRFPASRRAA